MRRLPILLLCLLVGAGCRLSKDESTMARLHDEMANKKKVPPKGFLTEDQIGVKYYPDADYGASSEHDEGGFHIKEVGLSTKDSTDKVRDFYEKEIGAKAMPTIPQFYSIQRDYQGKHYEIS